MSPHLKCRKDISSKKAAHRQAKRIKIKVMHINVVLIVCLMLVLGGYLVQVVQSTTAGFAMREVDVRFDEIRQANQDLEIQINERKSIDYIVRSAQELGLVAPGEIQHLPPISSGFAYK